MTAGVRGSERIHFRRGGIGGVNGAVCVAPILRSLVQCRLVSVNYLSLFYN